VHLGDKVTHLGQFGLAGMNNEVGSFGDDVQVFIGDNSGNFPNHVAIGLEPGHFKIYPNQHSARLAIFQWTPRKSTCSLEP